MNLLHSGILNPQNALLYAAQLLANISSLHAAGVVHGFVSPETVTITDEKYLVLTDSEGHEMYVYTAPEVILGWTHDSAVDSWGFGIVLYYMLIGFHPFGDRDGQEDRIVNAKSHPLKYLHLLDENLRDLVSKCLERNPAARPSISEIKAHPYFSEIDWSKMVTRHVGEHRDILRQTSTLFNPTESLSKSIAEMELAISNLDLTLEVPNYEKPLPKPPSEYPSVRRSEWFTSSVNILEVAGNSEAGPTSESKQLHNDKDQRMKLFWDLLDAEQDTQATSVPADELANTLTYFTSRPRRTSKCRSSVFPSPHLPLWRSSIEVSSTRLNKPAIKPQVQTILEYEDFNFPPGIERIGNGIGYTYSLPAASRSKLSICSSVPRSCHGMFGHSPKFSGLGIGLGQLTSRRPKANFIKKSWRNEGSPFSGNTTTVVYGSARPALTNASSASPLLDSDDGDTDDNGPLTPDTIAFEENMPVGKQEVYMVTETPTLRLVSASPNVIVV
ncbi:kinase-like domain-containing protein [Amanita rubescens]|nr:kinase-like domain-containing protein [Amanita rubescens]